MPKRESGVDSGSPAPRRPGRDSAVESPLAGVQTGPEHEAQSKASPNMAPYDDRRDEVGWQRSSSVTRVSVHTAKRDQKQHCFVEYIRHLHVDLISCCLANLGCNSGMSIRTLQYA